MPEFPSSAPGVVEIEWLRSWPSGHVHAHGCYPDGQWRVLCGVWPNRVTETFPPYAVACLHCWVESGVSRYEQRPWFAPPQSSHGGAS